jgi:DNA-binding HxlR family transcriptional regulator
MDHSTAGPTPPGTRQRRPDRGVGRETLRQTLDFATAHGWVTRNPGHGHPLRPEFVLTEQGAGFGPGCSRVWRTAVLLDAIDLLGRKWVPPVLRVLSGGPARFGEMRAGLNEHGVTDRALSRTLSDLRAGGLVSRQVVHGQPPGVLYSATPRAEALVSAIARL